VLNGYPKLVAIDEKANHQIVHCCGFGKAHRATHKTLDPGPQIDMLALDGLRMLFADGLLLGGQMQLAGPHPSVSNRVLSPGPMVVSTQAELSHC
jgi:hypothetical protein